MSEPVRPPRHITAITVLVISIVVGMAGGYFVTVRIRPNSPRAELCARVRDVDDLWTRSDFNRHVEPRSRKARKIASQLDSLRRDTARLALRDPELDGLRQQWLDAMKSTAHDLRNDDTGGEKLEDATNMTAPEELRTAAHCGTPDPAQD